ncbi:AAA family ATPase [Streptomyces sp. NPDC006649]|uniref:AAA family ATPase n=1 Tax=Streptomyces sp. NPDC006649 TaxID=3156896 RepID=UPI0033B3108D
MRDVRVVLIGGTSNVGKSTVAQVVADRLGFGYLSTDGLARHPGRPWRTPEQEVPEHVAEHYASHTVDQLISSVTEHYERLWPRIRELITEHAAGRRAGGGLVLEGSALRPARVAGLTVPRTAAVWLTASEAVIRGRVRKAGRYREAADHERLLMDRFLARGVRYQALMLEDADRLGLDRIDAGSGRTAGELADAVLTAVGTQYAIGRSAHR